MVGSHLKTDSGPVEGEASTESKHGAVRFTFDALYQFQGMQGFAEQKPMPQNMENFRKRPNYDGSRRKFFSKQYDRQSQLVARIGMTFQICLEILLTLVPVC